ncbi:MAG: hypothetical protein ACQERJ_01765 [Bacillota bacterium]
MSISKDLLIGFALRKYGTLNEDLSELWNQEYPNEDSNLVEQLERVNLADYNDRNNFYWELEVKAEEIIYSNSDLENKALADLIVEKWNQKDTKFPITQEAVLDFLGKKRFKFSKTQKGFRYLCEGDIDSYKMFGESPYIFADLLTRFMLLVYSYKSTGLDNSRKILKYYFASNGLKEYKNVIENRFREVDNFGLMTVYGRHMNLDKFVFTEGILKIINDYVLAVDKNEAKRMWNEITEAVNEQSNLEYELIVASDEITDETNAESGGEKNTEKSNKSSDKENKSEQDKKIENDSSQLNEESKKTMEIFKDNITERLDKLDNKVDQVLANQTQENSTTENQRMERLEARNLNLQRKLETLRRENDDIESKVMSKIIKKLGGKDANYLLSKLHAESKGELPNNRQISKGRLINLFSAFKSLGVKPYSAGKKLGEVFEVEKSELIDKFMLEDPINAVDDKLKVKLVGKGWIYNDQVLVMPLVKEVN